MIKVLNLYAGIGGNRKLWEDVEVTAIENDKAIAAIYKDFFPKDKVIVTDAHEYLLNHYEEYDFIWSSPPCPSHSRIRFQQAKLRKSFKNIYPDMKLYQEIIFLKHYFKGAWVVENVKGYYKPLIKPQELGRHFFWSNFNLGNYKHNKTIIRDKYEILERTVGFKIKDFHNYKGDKRVLLRNCVDSKMAFHIFNMAFKETQEVLKVNKG